MTDIWSRTARTGRWLLIGESIAALLITALSLAVTLLARTTGWAIAANVLLFLAFLTRRRFPKVTLTLGIVAGIFHVLGVYGLALVADLLYVPICAAFGSDRRVAMRRAGLVAAFLAIVVVVVGAIYRIVHADPHQSWSNMIVSGLMFASVTALICVGGWVWGYLHLQQQLRVEAAVASQVSNAERARLEDSYAQSVFRERIAGEMHDVVGHSWAVVAAQADGARYALATSPEAAAQALETIGDIARTSITELREILRQLRYTEGDVTQFSPEQQTALIERMRTAGMSLEFTETGVPSDNTILRLTAHRLLTEALTNALKHGDLSHPVTADLTWDDGFQLVVVNRRRSAGGDLEGLGLTGMRERAKALGGQVTTRARDDVWYMHASVPPPSAEGRPPAPSESKDPE